MDAYVDMEGTRNAGGGVTTGMGERMQKETPRECLIFARKRGGTSQMGGQKKE